jgi:hypothetical protein
MIEPFTIESRDPSASLALRPFDRDYFLAEVRHAGLHATARVGSYLSGGLGDFFSGLAADWTGWAGAREWGSLEGELTLRAESDRTGHVYLRVRLRRGAPAEWEVEVALVLEAGQLGRLAAGARAFERAALSAT